MLGNYYPDRFPSFWTEFNKAADNGHIVSVREVLRELENQITKPWLRDWIDGRRRLFEAPSDEETEFVREIFSVRHFQALVGQKQRLKGTPVADPWVIACARARGWCVVTEEEHRPNAAKIPNVCEHFEIPCLGLEGFLEDRDWRF